jgi:hypothetical protein
MDFGISSDGNYLNQLILMPNHVMFP